MQIKGLTLAIPKELLKEECLRMVAEYLAVGEHYSGYETVRQDFTAYLKKLDNQAKGLNLPPGIVPMDTFWLVKDGVAILGESRLRHSLLPHLRVEGGHIGYAIRPSARCQGYGTLILELTLEKARQMGLERVLVTCDHDNIGSKKIIEKNGGVLSGQGISPSSHKVVLQYWIEL